MWRNDIEVVQVFILILFEKKKGFQKDLIWKLKLKEWT